MNITKDSGVGKCQPKRENQRAIESDPIRPLIFCGHEILDDETAIRIKKTAKSLIDIAPIRS